VTVLVQRQASSTSAVHKGALQGTFGTSRHGKYAAMSTAEGMLGMQRVCSRGKAASDSTVAAAASGFSKCTLTVVRRPTKADRSRGFIQSAAATP
jgi:hypothetical protein